MKFLVLFFIMTKNRKKKQKLTLIPNTINDNTWPLDYKKSIANPLSPKNYSGVAYPTLCI